MRKPPVPIPLTEVVPGAEVAGYAVEQDGAIYVAAIMAPQPGTGQAKRFLDGLPVDRTIKFPNVISARLEQMLIRRGFRRTREWSPEFEEWIEVFVRP